MITKNNQYFELSGFWDQSDSDLLLFGEVSPESDNEALIEKVKIDIRENYEFALFSTLPGLATDFASLKKMARKLEIDPLKASLFAERLVRSGLWKIRDGKIQADFEFLDLGELTIKDFLSATVGIISRITGSKHENYNYETLTLATNRGLIRSFIGKVNSALKELHESSRAAGAEKNVLFSWSHTGIIEVEQKQKVLKSDGIH